MSLIEAYQVYLFLSRVESDMSLMPKINARPIQKLKPLPYTADIVDIANISGMLPRFVVWLWTYKLPPEW